MICQDCNKREHKVIFAEEPMYALTHGIGRIHLCRQCYIKRIKAELKRINNNLKEQERLLKEER
jgi:hypothetical protein